MELTKEELNEVLTQQRNQESRDQGYTGLIELELVGGVIAALINPLTLLVSVPLLCATGNRWASKSERIQGMVKEELN